MSAPEPRTDGAAVYCPVCDAKFGGMTECPFDGAVLLPLPDADPVAVAFYRAIGVGVPGRSAVIARLLRLVLRDFPRSRPERRAFVLGVREFRSDVTSNPGEDLIDVYDLGRELAHVATLRRFDASRRDGAR